MMKCAMRRAGFGGELGIAVELSAAAGIAAVASDRLGVENPGKIGVVICGTGSDGMA